MGWMSTPKIDNSGVNAAAGQNAETQRRLADLAEREYADGKARADQFDPLFQNLIQQSMDQSAKADQRGDEMWSTYKQYYLPNEKKLAETAANYDTEGRRQEAASTAAADVAGQFSNAREAQQRALGRAGVSMSSGRSLTLDNANRLEQAKATAGAKTAARRNVENTGLALLDNSVKTGRGLPSLGLAAGQQATSNTGVATGALGSQQAAYNSALAPATSLYGGSVNAGSSAGNLYLGAGQLQANANAGNAAGLAGLGQLAGTLGGMYASGMFGSSKKIKENKRPVRGLEEAALKGVSKLKNEGWDYKQGAGDGGTHVGPYAEDVRREFGDEVAPGGAMIDMRAMNGKTQLAIKALGARLDGIEAMLDELEAA